MANDYLFTSESVSEGHPDKVADQISDAILDAIFEQDPRSRVAAETLTNTGLVVLAGEITTNAHVDYIQVARDTIKRIGYDNTEYGIDYKGCAVMVCYDKQSNDIAQGVDHASDDHLNTGAGDQGLMFGYACSETPDLMPAPIYYAHRLVERQAQLRKDGRLPFLRPDAKSQVTMRYVDGKPHSIDTVVLSTQHSPDQSESSTKMKASFNEAIIEEIKDEFIAWTKQRKFAPTIHALKAKLNAIKEGELNVQRKKITNFDEEQAELISARIIQKITNHFANHLKEDETVVDESIEWIEKIFQLETLSK